MVKYMAHIPHPEIQGVLREISAMIKNHDMAGLVILSKPGADDLVYTEHIFEASPSWSCLILQHDKKGTCVRFRSLASEHAAKGTDKKKMEEDTMSMMGGIEESAVHVISGIHHLLALLKERLDATTKESPMISVDPYPDILDEGKKDKGEEGEKQ